MPTTRRQTAIKEGKIKAEKHHKMKDTGLSDSTRKGAHSKQETAEAGTIIGGEPELGVKREVDQTQGNENIKGLPPSKKLKTEATAGVPVSNIYQAGTIDRGHIYFFYRPRVQLTEATSINDVRHLHMLLVPRPPQFSQSDPPNKGTAKADPVTAEESVMSTLAPGADALPATDNGRSSQRHYRLITIGKKKLPDPEKSSQGKRKEVVWATVTKLGDDLEALEKTLGESSYETKTRGTRHIDAARLVARGGYAIVNKEAQTPSQRETHLGYSISHPAPNEMGEVQAELGIYSASSFVLQVKNPLASATNQQQARSKGAEYPDWIMKGTFGSEEKGHTKGRESYGLRFASCETPDLLDFIGAELLLIAARAGEGGLEESLDHGRGGALVDMEHTEGQKPIQEIFDELRLDLEKFPAQPLEGSWI